MPTNPEPDYYEILGVEQDATQEEIDKAFRKARRDNHPDKSSAGAWAFRLVEMAYDTLKDPDSRAAYDEKQRRGDDPEPAPQQTQTTQSASAPNEPASAPATTTQTASPSPVSQTAAPVPSTPPVDVVQHEQFEVAEMDSEKLNFVPAPTKFLPQIAGSLGLSAAGAIGMFATWFMPSLKPAFVGLAFLLTLFAVAAATKKPEVPKAGIASVILLVVGWVITGVPLSKLDTPMHQPIYLVMDVVYMLGGVVALLFVPRYLKIRNLNKRVPVKLLKTANVYGSPSSPEPQEAVIKRNISDTLTPIVLVKNGTFAIHVNGILLPDDNGGDVRYPGEMVVINGNKVAIVSHMYGPAGQYGVTQDGNIVLIIQNGLTHVENNNPQVLMAAKAIKKHFPDVEVQSVMIVIPVTAGTVTSYHAEGTSVVSRQEAFKELQSLFEEPTNVVRRDVINLFVPSISG